MSEVTQEQRQAVTDTQKRAAVTFLQNVLDSVGAFDHSNDEPRDRGYVLHEVATALAEAEARGRAEGRAEAAAQLLTQETEEIEIEARGYRRGWAALAARIEALAEEHDQAADSAAAEAARIRKAGQVPVGVVDYHQQQADKAYYIAALLRALADTEGA